MRLCNDHNVITTGPGQGMTCTGSAHIGGALVTCTSPHHHLTTTTGRVILWLSH